jgi:hypothetical protein
LEPRKGNIRTWRCSKKNKQCRAYIVTENSWIIYGRHIHNHTPGPPIRSLVSDSDPDTILQDFFGQMAAPLPLFILPVVKNSSHFQPTTNQAK